MHVIFYNTVNKCYVSPHNATRRDQPSGKEKLCLWEEAEGGGGVYLNNLLKKVDSGGGVWFQILQGEWCLCSTW